MGSEGRSVLKPLLALLACLGCLPLAACAIGAAQADPKADETVEKAAANATKVESARVNMTLKMSMEDPPPQLAGGNLMDMKIDAVQSKLPDGGYNGRADIDMTAAGRNMRMNTLIVGKQSYLGYNGVYYEMPASSAGSLSGNYIQTMAGELGKLLDSASYDGTELVGGVATDHVHSSLGGGQLGALIKKVYSAQPAFSGMQNGDAGKASDALGKYVKDGRIDLYVGSDDGIVRRVYMQLTMDIQGSTAKMTMDMLASDINRVGNVEVSRPANVRPFSSFQSDLLQGIAGGTPQATPPGYKVYDQIK